MAGAVPAAPDRRFSGQGSPAGPCAEVPSRRAASPSRQERGDPGLTRVSCIAAPPRKPRPWPGAASPA